jgi:2-dehydropantoate 2-reductase
MKIAVIGPGAMGCLFCAYLHKAGHEVHLVDHRAERARQLAASGLFVKGVRGDVQVKVPVTDDARTVGVAELVLVSVKAYKTEQALSEHQALIGPETMVWSVQNGLGITEAMAKVVAASQILAGSTTLGANLLAVGRVHHAGDGDTILGELDGKRSERVEQLARLLSAAGFSALVSEDIGRVVWNKLLVNVGINALTAILWVRNGVLLEHAPARRLMHAAVDEALLIAAAQGLTFDRDQVIARVEEVARRTSQNRSSMLADLQARRRTEIDFINGAVAALGDAPVNRTLTDLVHTLETTAGQRQETTG